ncbi:arsenate reductase/protein-tyrosine-phosphatase family protein [Pararhodobacter marinus]|uniref:arsenate reductase/protein-tyrosine-phosphatase family protein n=1 Tax=Pararhodobacter marinus TaxID=2184063 RepID=UPI0035152BDC
MLVLFVCTANKLRSPTAEDVFKSLPGIDVLSAGTNPSAPRVMSRELVAKAALIFVMEPHHRERIRKKFKARPPDNRIITLHIPDEFERGDPVLIDLLRQRVTPHLDAFQGPEESSTT